MTIRAVLSIRPAQEIYSSLQLWIKYNPNLIGNWNSKNILAVRWAANTFNK